MLCNVCVHLWSVPGPVLDAWYEHMVDFDAVEQVVDDALERWYRAPQE